MFDEVCFVSVGVADIEGDAVAVWEFEYDRSKGFVLGLSFQYAIPPISVVVIKISRTIIGAKPFLIL